MTSYETPSGLQALCVIYAESPEAAPNRAECQEVAGTLTRAAALTGHIMTASEQAASDTMPERAARELAELCDIGFVTLAKIYEDSFADYPRERWCFTCPIRAACETTS